MNAKQWMKRARRTDEEIERLEEARERLEARLTSVTQSYEGDGVQSTKDPHKFDRIAEIDSMISERKDELKSIVDEILAMINSLPDQLQRIVLISYYINCKTWEQTAVDIGYSYMQVTRINGQALIEVEERLKML